MRIIPIILCGGYGKRLWPLSRHDLPKQFLRFSNLSSGRTLFEQALLRCRRGIFDQRPIIVGSTDHRFLIGEALGEFGLDADILLEPAGRNTCAAIAAACLQARERSDDALVMVMAADHDIEDGASFARSVGEAIQPALSGHLVTFGIRPDAPNSNYGYVGPGKADGKCYPVSGFVEKPAKSVAERLISQGYMWNSGNFLFDGATALGQIRLFQPALLDLVELAFERRQVDNDFIRLDEDAYGQCLPVSFDHGVLEKTELAVMMPVSYNWCDVGNWDGLARLAERDESGNAILGDFVSRDSRNNIIHSEGRFTALLGVENLVVVTTGDAVLVADRSRSAEVRGLVEDLARRDHRTLQSGKTRKPWGSFETIATEEDFQIKRLCVLPGEELSLQRHRMRAEHWVVIAGIAEVVVDNHKQTCHPGNGIFIPTGSVHRLINPGSEALVVIEVQTGEYFGEDDLVRLDDKYHRSQDPAE